jgi:flavin reductase (DIM6/NTAB) family NADH-FMN oxidoreductase RutF
MSSDHEELCRKFAAKRELGRFEGVTWHAHRSVPRLQGAIAWLNCRIWAEHDAGDHTVVIAQVDALDAGDGLPLVFFKGRYGTFT